MTVQVTYEWEPMPWLTEALNSPGMVSELEAHAEAIARVYWRTAQWTTKTSTGGWPPEPTVMILVYDDRDGDEGPYREAHFKR